MNSNGIDQEALELFLLNMALVDLDLFVNEFACSEAEVIHHYDQWEQAINKIYKGNVPISLQEALDKRYHTWSTIRRIKDD